MVYSLAPNTEPCGTHDANGRLCEREAPTHTWLFLCSMYDWNHLKAVPVIRYIYCSLFRRTL